MTAVGLTLLLAAIVFLVYCSALFSGLETALFALKSHQIQRLQEQHPSLADFLRTFRDNPRRVLNVLLLGDTMVNVPLVILCLVFIWEGPLITHLPAWVAALAIFALVVLLCDLIPKLLALSTAYRISALGVFTLKLMMPLLDRVGHLLENASTLVIDRLTPAKLRVRPRISDEELETLVEMGEAEGTLQEAEGEMIQEIIKLGDKTAKDCMTPRVDTFAVPDDLPNEEAIALFKQRRHRRVPVYAETPDQIAGIVDVKQFLLDPSRHYTETLIAPSFVPETMPAMELLRRFLSHPQGLAIVVDEFGGTEGIVTLGDIIEEILSDAAPLGDAELYIKPLEEGRFLVSGNARLDDLTEHLGLELTADGIDTIGGYIFNRLGYLPNVGARLEIPRLALTIRRVSRKRIEEVLLEKTAAGAERSPGGGGRQGSMISWFVIFVCWVVSFVFGGIEAGLLSLDQVRLRHQVKLRNRSAILLDLLLKKPERLLATILLVTNLADIAGLLLLTKRLVGLLGTAGYAGRAPGRRSHLPFPARSAAEVALSPLSLPRPCRFRRFARLHFARPLAGPGTWRPPRPAPLSADRRAPSPLRRARGFETACRRERTPGRADFVRARHDP